jgi:hypothetical protein
MASNCNRLGLMIQVRGCFIWRKKR